MKSMKMNEAENQVVPHGPRPRPTGSRRAVTGLLLGAVLVAWCASLQAGPVGVGGKRGLKTMTVNLYVGGGIERVMALNPSDPAYLSNLVFTVTGVFYEIAASQPDVRMAGVADRIAGRMPDLVAVQEASLIRIQSPGDLLLGGTTPATNVVYDYVTILVDALNARGAHYRVASVAEEVDVELPMLSVQTGTIDDVRLTDREAILVRADLPPGQLRVSNPQSGHFTHVIELPGLQVRRGWCSVDAFVRGTTFRYINAHLEEETVPQLQMAQALELLGGPAAVRLPVVLVGDFNADALGRTGTQTYGAIVAAGFNDAWGVTHPGDPAGGLTWGHDEFLADPALPFIWRLDYVFYRGGGFTPIGADVLDMSLGRAEPPLWASDHAAVAAQFRIR